MAQLKDTTVNGDLTVSGHVVNNVTPTNHTHLINKGYLDEIGTVRYKGLTEIGNNFNAPGAFHRYTVDNYTGNFNVTLPRGTYLFNYSLEVTGEGQGTIVAIIKNGSEELGYRHGSRATASTAANVTTTINGCFIFWVEEETDYSIHPELYSSTVYWTGRGNNDFFITTLSHECNVASY